jgi:hypothetical protein
MKEVIPSSHAGRETIRQAHRACATVAEVLGRKPKYREPKRRAPHSALCTPHSALK